MGVTETETFDECVMEPVLNESYGIQPSEEYLEAKICCTVSDKPEKIYDMDLSNISLNSYELLDYTLQNCNIQPPELIQQSGEDMHVSMSEEVNENLKIILTNNNSEIKPEIPEKHIPTSTDEQIVFRRQRRKKSKSDTPKKRVSFHEDILNSTKIDDIHINHGFITHESDVSTNFFQRGFIKKPDTVVGRYSWAAEGDAPFYEKQIPQREVKSDIYVQRGRFSSSSSSSSNSISSSIDEEDVTSNSEESIKTNEPSQKMPKSSCLKKTKHRNRIDTDIVQEEVTVRKKKSETNLLDANIFGSFKNMFNFSSSLPFAERGVPEGQEDIHIYSSSSDVIKCLEELSVSKPTLNKSSPTNRNVNVNLESAKNNLKLTKGEGFHPIYPSEQNLPGNIILCDNNIYEHRGVSYSYEYEQYQKTFEQPVKTKSSSFYQMIKGFSFFGKRKGKEEPHQEKHENVDKVYTTSTPTKEGNIQRSSDGESSQLDDFKMNNYLKRTSLCTDISDNNTDFTETNNTRHLNSPKKKINKSNHYSVHSFRVDIDDDKFDMESQVSSKVCQGLKSTSSKMSLINKYLRNVTNKKLLDMKQSKIKKQKYRLPLFIPGIRPDLQSSKELDKQIEEELEKGLEIINKRNVGVNYNLRTRLKREVLRDDQEDLLKVYPVRSAYTTVGESQPLLLLITYSTIYITGLKPNNSFCNYFVLPYTELNTILIGPNAQTIHFSNFDNDMQFIITTRGTQATNEIVAQLEMAVRNDSNKPILPAIKQLSLRDMANLRKSVCKQSSVDKDEEYYHYSIVYVQDFNSDMGETPLGPSKEGPLMFKMEGDTRWETAYFILKAGILYMLSSPTHRLPMRVLPLINGNCQGARRTYNPNRPHTFQLQVGATTLMLAAPDEYIASEWLQVLVLAASKTYMHKDKISAQSCSLLMTGEHILTVREAFPYTINNGSSHQPIKGTQVLSCASISDLTALRLPSAEQSWSILEFACREVHESSGDWIVYFSSNDELETFLSTLEMLWMYQNEEGECFPLSTIPETDALSKTCVDTYTMLQRLWPSFNI
ncbi:uncharacterized protein LOC108732885 [Agrilus planipennis]|uniref:Uncharacterized protein LOC108732885 n=1 Tax=Agrilus planipennis TaxID=224129 RepID=A0A1W4W5H8_AGRPL|nr:uncharacterized protein LOC108732885 [Agrilus planipennis]